jgi:hypothetical protein
MAAFGLLISVKPEIEMNLKFSDSQTMCGKVGSKEDNSDQIL